MFLPVIKVHTVNVVSMRSIDFSIDLYRDHFSLSLADAILKNETLALYQTNLLRHQSNIVGNQLSP